MSALSSTLRRSALIGAVITLPMAFAVPAQAADVPSAPTSLEVGNRSCDTDPLYTTDRKPLLHAALAGQSPMTVTWEITGGPTAVAPFSGIAGPTSVNTRTPIALADGSYELRANVTNGSGTSDWSTPCAFTVDATPPSSAPVITLLTANPREGEHLAFELSTDDPTVTSYSYGFGVDAPQHRVDAVGGVATIGFDDVAAGPHVLYVWGRDDAGNLGARGDRYVFAQAIPRAHPLATWRLDDGVLTSRQETVATLTTGAGWTPAPDRDGAASAALATDGTSCAESTRAIVQPAGTYFSAAAWVRPEGDGTVLAQYSGSVLSYRIRFDTAASTWVAEFPAAGSDTATVLTVPATANAWSHLAVSYGENGLLRFHVNGSVAAETVRTTIPYPDGTVRIGCETTTTGLFTGAVDDIGLWAGPLDGAGVAAAMANLAWEIDGYWRLDTSADDGSFYGHPVTLHGQTGLGEDRYGWAETLWLNGSGHATAGPAARTDRSFSVQSWVRLDDLTADHTVVSQPGAAGTAFRLGFDVASGGWTVALSAGDDPSATEVAVHSDAAATTEWTLLTATVDVSTGLIRLYVNGSAQQGTATWSTPWRATGPLVFGAVAEPGAAPSAVMVGGLQDAMVARGVMPEEAIRNYAGI